jgi:hypothetical protein
MKSARSEPYVVRRLTPSPSELAQGDGRHMAARMTRRRPDGRYQVKVTTPDGPRVVYLPAGRHLCTRPSRPSTPGRATGAAGPATGMHARLSATRQARTRRRRGPSVAVREKPTVRTDCPGGTDTVRHTSVDPATQGPTALRSGTGGGEPARLPGDRDRLRRGQAGTGPVGRAHYRDRPSSGSPFSAS